MAHCISDSRAFVTCRCFFSLLLQFSITFWVFAQDIECKEKVQSLVQGGNEEQAEQLNTRVTDAHGGDSGSLSASSNDACWGMPCTLILFLSNQIKTLLQVQNLIERCLQLYMNKGEVVRTLSNRARIEPGFTTLGEVFLHSILQFVNI
jgi:hypothetical protein